jgi:putative membrane protein
MRSMLIPATALAVLTFCSPNRDRQTSDTGMGGATSGGISSNDTISTMSSSAGDTASSANSASSTSTPATPAGMLSQLNVANMTEIQVAGMAAKKATSAQVKQVAKKLVTDHTMNESQLKALAKKLKVDLTSAQGGNVMAADSAALPSDLQGVSGKQFDQAFVRHEVEDHQSNIEKIRNQMIPAASNPQVKAFLQKTVTAMEGHLAALKRVQQQVGA